MSLKYKEKNLVGLVEGKFLGLPLFNQGGLRRRKLVLFGFGFD